METIEVTARFGPEGQIHPLSFVRSGRTYRVETIGRRWEDERGLHFLVMAPLERVFELLFIPSEGRWYLRRAGLERFLA